jgi:hypothetical protein
LDSQSAPQKTDEKINIILSPSLYWVKKISLPVKYVRDAKKLLPSLFEDSISEGNYSYYVYKQGEYFFAFAYEDKVILEVLKEKGIALQNIAKIYFAQSELGHIENALKIDETQSIVLKDDLIILLPCCWVEESATLDLAHVVHTKHTITLAQYNHIVDKGSLYKISAVMVAFIFLLSIEYIFTLQRVQEVQSTQENLFEKRDLKPTMFQNKSLLKKYTKLHTKQMKLRVYMAQILSLKLRGDDKLYSLTQKDKKLVATFGNLKNNEIGYIKSKLKSKKVSFNSFYKKEIFYVEMPL